MRTLGKRQLILGTVVATLTAPLDRAFAQAPEANRNKEVLIEAYRRWNDTKGGSVDHWMSIVDENIALGSIAEGSPPAPFTAALKGRSQLNRYFDGMLSSWSMVHHTIQSFIAEGDRVVAFGHIAWRNKATIKVFESPKVDIWRFRDGRAVEFYEYYDTAKLAAAAI